MSVKGILGSWLIPVLTAIFLIATGAPAHADFIVKGATMSCATTGDLTKPFLANCQLNAQQQISVGAVFQKRLPYRWSPCQTNDAGELACGSTFAPEQLLMTFTGIGSGQTLYCQFNKFDLSNAHCFIRWYFTDTRRVPDPATAICERFTGWCDQSAEASSGATQLTDD